MASPSVLHKGVRGAINSACAITAVFEVLGHEERVEYLKGVLDISRQYLGDDVVSAVCRTELGIDTQIEREMEEFLGGVIGDEYTGDDLGYHSPALAYAAELRAMSPDERVAELRRCAMQDPAKYEKLQAFMSGPKFEELKNSVTIKEPSKLEMKIMKLKYHALHGGIGIIDASHQL